MKRVISLMLALSMLVALIPAMTLSVSADEPSHPNPLCFTANTAGSKVKLEKKGNAPSPIWYKKDGTWNSYTAGSYITLTNVGDKVYFAGDGIFNTIYPSQNYQFVMTGSLSASGSLSSLLNSTTDVTDLSGSQNWFYYLFSGCDALTDASNLILPATTLGRNCYFALFEGCTSLKTAPKLPAKTLAVGCYTMMFNGCTSLVNAPVLPATTLVIGCYCKMFEGCSALEITTTDYSADPTYGCWNFDSIDISTPNSCVSEMMKNTKNFDATYNVKAVKYYFPLGAIVTTNDEVEREDDPEVDIVVDGKTQTLKYGNNTVVIDENTFLKTAMTKKMFYTVDYSESNAKIFDLIIPNKVAKKIANDNKGIEFINKYGYMVVSNIDENNNNSLVLRLKNTVASYAQIKAMNTKHVEAEVEVGYKSNGKSLPGNVKVYVPCDMETARVFYIIDKNTIGEWKCEVKDGWCIFDRYLDGTYVVCK